ncbi:hypothetical protein [Thioclava sp.]|uniref:hypothetical protein n=1 Tax=Thioclava sp. TaxID=1933450 RepID=UPI0032429467
MGFEAARAADEEKGEPVSTLVRHSCVRAFVKSKKNLVKDTGWQSGDLPPRYSVYAVTRPCAKRWEWRCFSLEDADGRQFRLLVEVSPQLGKWKAMLISISEGKPPRALMRFEDQPGPQGGLHVHANCETNRDLTGAETVNMTYTLPDHGRRRRRHQSWTKALFCVTAGTFFGNAALGEQEELGL